MKIQIVS